MATIVLHRRSGLKYIVVGAGFAVSKTSTPSLLLGSLAPQEESEAVGMIALADPNGAVLWVHSPEVVVVEVDGKSPSQWLTAEEPYR